MSTFKSLLPCWVILVISRRCDVTNAAAGSRENPPAARQHAQHELTGGRRVYCHKALECLHHTHYPLEVTVQDMQSQPPKRDILTGGNVAMI